MAEMRAEPPATAPPPNREEVLRFIQRECRQVSINNGWGQGHARGLADRILDAIAALPDPPVEPTR